MKQHTPGPLRIQDYETEDGVLFLVRKECDTDHVAQIPPEFQQYAPLLAAAPDLLEALTAILEDEVSGVVLHEYIVQARAVIDKVERPGIHGE